MIEVVSETRCTQCNICVAVCPTNVFDIVKDHAPAIARQEDCQTCFMCEVYCPDDALYVHPNADEAVAVDAAALERNDVFGSYRRSVGWSKQARDETGKSLMHRLYTSPYGT